MICEFGSEPKPTTGEFDRFYEADIGGILPSLAGLVWSWTLGLPTGYFDTETFCSTEPTGDLPSDADWAALAFPPLAIISGAYRRFGNQVRAWKFADICQCSGNPSPSCVNTSFTSNGQSWIAATAVGINLEWGSRFTALVDCEITGIAGYSRPSGDLSNRDLHLWDETGTPMATQNGFPTPAGHWVWTFPTPIPMDAGETWTVSETTLSGSTVAQLAGGSADMPTNAYFTWGVPYYAIGSNTWPQSTGGSNRLSIMPVTCGRSGESPIEPPEEIPPPEGFPDPVLGPEECNDSYVCATLYSLNEKIDLLSAMLLDALQRMNPYGVSPGSIFTGLTGSGSLSAPGILGLHVTLTTVPGTYGSTATIPRRLIPSAGTILFETPDGLTRQEWVHYEDQLILDAPPITTSVKYSFRPGIVATIQLLNPLT